MSKCIVYLNINGERLELSLEDSDPSVLIDNSIVRALNENSEALDTLVENLRLLGNSTDIKPVELKDIQKEGVLANCTTEFIRTLPLYADIRFPDVNANILLVDNLKIGGVDIHGRTVNANGEEIIIVKNTHSDIMKLANYLAIKDAIQQGAILDESSQYYPKLKELYNKKKRKKSINKVEDIILDYMQDKKGYSSLTFSDGSSVIQFMEKLSRSLLNYSLPKEYNSPIVTELNYRKTWLGNKQIYISYTNLYTITKQYIPDLLSTLNIKSEEDFITLLKLDKGEISNAFKQLLDVNIQELDNTKALYLFMVQGEPEFDYYIIDSNNKGILLKSDFIPISDAYSISYDTIAVMPSEEYRGYTIYNKDNSLFFVSRGSLLEESKVKPTTTIEEAKTKIDNYIEKLNIKDNSFIEFMFRDSYVDEEGKKHYSDTYSENIKSKTKLKNNQLIGVLDIPIDPNTSISGNESWLLNGAYTLEDFYKIVDSYSISKKQKDNIKEYIDTPQKAAAYIYKVNELLGTENRNNGAKLFKIADDISKAKNNYYYIESIHRNNGEWEYKLIKTDLNEINEYKPNTSYPSTLWFNAISTVLNNEFGVLAHIVTATEIKELFKDIADPNFDKAFIYNGEVYINSSIASTNDLLHEYVHLILGVLKSNPDLVHNYEELVRGIYYSKDGQKEADRIKEAYSKLSEMDVMEEVFCNLFSDYIRKRINKDTLKIFDASEKELKKYTSNIFNTPIDSFSDFYNKTIANVFGKFKKEVSYMLLHENIDFGSTKLTRQITNWISQQIQEGNITENC